jgi:hypothetical protein
MYPVLWVYFHYQMHMVGHDLYPLQFTVAFDGHAADDFPQALVHLINQHPPPVLRAPDNMIDTRIDHIVVGTESSTHVLHYTTMVYIMQAFLDSLIPMPKGRGLRDSFSWSIFS